MDAFQIVEHGVEFVWERRSVLGVGDQRREDVDAGEQQLDEFGGGENLAITQSLEQAFEHVSELADFIDAERGARALDAVRGAEHRVEQLGVVGPRLQLEQRGFHVLQMLVGFREKRRAEPLQIDFHRRAPRLFAPRPQPARPFRLSANASVR